MSLHCAFHYFSFHKLHVTLINNKQLVLNIVCILYFQLSDKVFEVSQLRASLEDYEKSLSESECKYKSEIARLKNKNHELQFTLEETQRERPGGTPKLNVPVNSQAASCNGDFLSEGGSLVSHG